MNQILIVKLGALGDVILAMDAFQAIRAHHPHAHITLLTRKPFVSLASQMPWFDAIIPDPSPKLLQIGKWLHLRKILKTGGFQRVYDLQTSDRTALYFNSLRPNPPEWCGTANGCSHQRHDHRQDPVPAAESLLRFLESVDVPRAGPADTSWLTGDIAALALPEKFVMIVPGCAPQHPHKRWPATHFADLAHQLDAQGIATVAVGTAVEQAAIQEIQSLTPSLINLVDKTEIGQLAEVARHALGVVGNDTGPIHIAAITGAPTLVLMSGKTDPVRMTPLGPDVGWLRRENLTELPPSEVLKSIRLRHA
jgi:ADP-heptose:LPS heptosyltransferase